MVGLRRTPDGYDVYAPHGFDDIAGLIVRPNPGASFSATNYAAKAARWKAGLESSGRLIDNKTAPVSTSET